MSKAFKGILKSNIRFGLFRVMPSIATKRFPKILHIPVSYQCNFRCAMCSAYSDGSQISKGDGLLPFKDWCAIIDQIPSCNVQIRPFGVAGEPLMNKELVNMLSYQCKQGLKSGYLSTNGALLTEDVQQKLLALDVNDYTVQISIDGLKESCEAQRKGCDWDLVVQNLKSFLRLKRQQKSNMKIAVACTITDQPHAEIEEFTVMMGKLGVDEILIQSSTYQDGDRCRWNERSLIDKDLVPEDFHVKYTCPFLYNFLEIRPDLKAYAICCRDWFYSGAYPFEKKPIKDLWASAQYDNLRRDQYVNRPGTLCHQCEYKFYWWPDYKTLPDMSFGNYSYHVYHNFCHQKYTLNHSIK